ncbi:MAG: hypothetical protein ACOYEJ_07305 [Mahellales bacterium]|jgi:hypothetical protein
MNQLDKLDFAQLDENQMEILRKAEKQLNEGKNEEVYLMALKK